MSEPYEEVVAGEYWLRFPPGERHEAICERLHSHVAASLVDVPGARRLPPREAVRVKPDTVLRPDLAIIDPDTGQLWLAAEVISANDHRPDTVAKKALYEELNVPRLWIVDPRYDNVEVYERGEYGLALTRILAVRDRLTEERLPRLQIVLTELFVD
ncbi:MAG: Uma2 family endonuclease [Limisphaerales bacterium]